MREKHTPKLRRSACGQCFPCQQKLNCGKCSACCRKTMKTKCEKRKCVLLKKLKGGGNFYLTLRLSRNFLETVTALNLGEKLDIFDSMYENLSISSESEKIKIEIQDDKSVILCEPGNRYFVDIGYCSDEWVLNRKLDVENNRAEQSFISDVAKEEETTENQSKEDGYSCDTMDYKDDSEMNDIEPFELQNSLKNESLNDEPETEDKDFECDGHIVGDNLEKECNYIHAVNNSVVFDEHFEKLQSDQNQLLDEPVNSFLESSDNFNSVNRVNKKADEKVKCIVEKEKEVEFKFKCVSYNCEKVFQSYQSLVSHIKKKHNKTKEFHMVMENANTQNKIVSIKRDEIRALMIQCPVCKFEYKNCFSGIDKHMISVHHHLGNFLEICKNIIEQRQHHTESRNQLEQCELCLKRIESVFYHLHIQQEHCNNEQGKELIKNLFDIKSQVPQESEVSVRQKSTKKNPCQYCGKLYTQGHMNSHYRVCKSNPDSVSYIFCYCGFRTRTDHPEKMLKHKKECKGHKIEYICDLCGKVCKSLSTKFQHRKFAHGIMGERSTEVKEYKCDYCDKVYNLPCRLRRHMRCHSDVRNYVCDVCGRAFKCAEHLTIHRKSLHQNKYRYYCNNCGHGVNKPKDLRNHVCGRVRRRNQEDESRHLQENIINLSVRSSQQNYPKQGTHKQIRANAIADQFVDTSSDLIKFASVNVIECSDEDAVSLQTLIQCSVEGDSQETGTSIKMDSCVKSNSVGTELTDSKTQANELLKDVFVKKNPTALLNHNNASSPVFVYAQSVMHANSILTQTVNSNYTQLPVNLSMNQPQKLSVSSDSV